MIEIIFKIQMILAMLAFGTNLALAQSSGKPPGKPTELTVQKDIKLYGEPVGKGLYQHRRFAVELQFAAPDTEGPVLGYGVSCRLTFGSLAGVIKAGTKIRFSDASALNEGRRVQRKVEFYQDRSEGYDQAWILCEGRRDFPGLGKFMSTENLNEIFGDYIKIN